VRRHGARQPAPRGHPREGVAKLHAEEEKSLIWLRSECSSVERWQATNLTLIGSLLVIRSIRWRPTSRRLGLSHFRREASPRLRLGAETSEDRRSRDLTH